MWYSRPRLWETGVTIRFAEPRFVEAGAPGAMLLLPFAGACSRQQQRGHGTAYLVISDLVNCLTNIGCSDQAFAA